MLLDTLPNEVTSSTYEGAIDSFDPLNLEMGEQDVLRSIGRRVEDAISFWDDKLRLSTVEKENEVLWLTGLSESGLYDYQTPYKDPRIFTAVEQLVPMVTSNPPMPVVIEAHDTDASRELSTNIKKMLLAKWSPNELDLKQKFEKVARHLLVGYRRAFQKYKWDTNRGRILNDGTRKGDVSVMTLRPQKVVLEYGGSDDTSDIPLIAESIESTIEELCQLFPAKADQVMSAYGYENGVALNLSTRVNYREVWFSYFDKAKKGKKGEAVAWKIDNILLDYYKNPNWNYDEWEKDEFGNLKLLNFFDRPKKPYVTYNFLNLGRYPIDDTSLTEQAKNMQLNLNKRGRQIMENGDAANSGLIFNTTMISPDDIAAITGDTTEKIGVAGDVRQAATRLPALTLPDYVIEDKYDSRAEIDTIFGTEAPLRGAKSGNKTATQDVISQRANMTRSETVSSSLERGAIQLYGGLVQLYKVFYDVEDYERYTGKDGKTAFFMFSRDRIEDGIGISIKAGTMLPDDPVSKVDRTVQLWQGLDPLSIAQGIGEEDAEEAAKRMFLYKFDPGRYATEILNLNVDGNTDYKAILDIKQLNEGQPVPPQQNPTQSHIAQHQAFIDSDVFNQLSPEVQKAHINHTAQETLLVKQALAGQQPQGLLGRVKAMMGMGGVGASGITPPQAAVVPQTPQQPTVAPTA